jgi:hypothetical protein
MLASPHSSPTAREAALWKKYTRSGLYRNDGSGKPLWTIKGYSRRAFPASDGVHLVCVSQFGGGFESWKQAVRFYASGQLIRAYSVDDLTTSWLLSDSPSGRIWFRQDRFDEANLQYTVWTSDGNSFTFDIRTGEIVSRFVWWRWGIGIPLTVGAVTLVAWCLSWRCRRRTTPAPPRGALIDERQGKADG